MIISKRFHFFVDLELHCKAWVWYATYLTLWIRNLGREKKKPQFLFTISFLDRFSASTVVSMEMAKNEIFSYCLFCFWNGNGWVMLRSVYKWSVFCIVFIFLLSERLMKSIEPPSLRFFGHGKWFAPIYEGATFAWRLITTRVSRTCNLFRADLTKGIRIVASKCVVVVVNWKLN